MLLLGLGISLTPQPRSMIQDVLSWSETLAFWDAATGIDTSTWTDRKAGLVMTASSAPVWSATSFNGAPGWTLDGVDDCFTLASQPFPSGANGVEIFAVAQQSALVADTSTRNLFSYGGTAGTSARILQRRVLSGVSRAVASVGNGSTNTIPNDASVSLASRHLMSMRVTPTDAYVSVDGGTEVSAAVVPATGTTRARIGANTGDTAAAFWNGIVRCVVVTGPLTAEKRSSVQQLVLPLRAL